MAKSFINLRDRMAPEARKASRLKAQAMLQAMPLKELRLARMLSQEQMAAELKINQFEDLGQLHSSGLTEDDCDAGGYR